MKRQIGVVFGIVLGLWVLIQPSLADDGPNTFSLKLRMGPGFSSDSDLGTWIRAFDDYVRDLADLWGLQLSGGAQWKNLSGAFGGELSYSITRRFGLGIGVDYMVKTKDNQAELGPFPYIEGYLDFGLYVIPLTLSAYYYMPVSQRTHVYVKGGTGYYWSRISYEVVREAFGETVRMEGDIRDKAFGFHGGAGLEFKVSDSIALFCEGVGRLVKFSSWEGDETEFETGEGSYTTRSAPVWYVEEWYGGFDMVEYYPSIYLGEEPVDIIGFRNARKFSVNFSGLTFQMGVRISFGK